MSLILKTEFTGLLDRPRSDFSLSIFACRSFPANMSLLITFVTHLSSGSFPELLFCRLRFRQNRFFNGLKVSLRLSPWYSFHGLKEFFRLSPWYSLRPRRRCLRLWFSRFGFGVTNTWRTVHLWIDEFLNDFRLLGLPDNLRVGVAVYLLLYIVW